MMEDIIVKMIEEPELSDPVLVEGLPGVGNVGKLAAEHLIGEMSFKRFCMIYSKHLPPQVSVGDDGIVELVRHELHYLKGDGKRRDIVILAGDYQGLTPEGQYILAHETIEIAKKLGIREIYTLGGFGVVRMVSGLRLRNPSYW